MDVELKYYDLGIFNRDVINDRVMYESVEVIFKYELVIYWICS